MMELLLRKSNLLNKTTSQLMRHGRMLTVSSVLGNRGDANDKYLERSKIPTMHFQASLPRLPIPDLEATCQRYLRALRPVLSDEEYERTEKEVARFSKPQSDVWELNQRLILQDSNNKHTSFIADYWYDMYLKDRRSIVLNHNPGIVFKQDPRTPSQVDRAANMIKTAVRFRNSLLDNKLKPEVYHLDPLKSDKPWYNLLRFVPSSFSWYASYMVNAFPLDMVQYKKLFNSTRIPRPVRDELVSYPSGSHVLVIHKGHMYCVDAVQPNGMPVDINDIHASLEAIISDPIPPSPHPLGYLTSCKRDDWSRLRKELISDDDNSSMLELVDSALFVLCLDEKEIAEDPKDVTETFIHNRGFNRWFDKSLQLIISRNGIAGVNFEHSWGDGVAVLRFFNEIYKETTQKPSIVTPSTDTRPLPKRLDFKLSDELKAGIEIARKDIEEHCDSVSVSTLQYHSFGKTFLKKSGFSPDGIMQLGFQIAYYRQYKCAPPTYESCSTAGFKHGRTETIRPASVETLQCSKAFEKDSGANVAEKIKLINAAVAWHSKLVREAATGKGFDRHLFALKCLAESEYLSFPLFQDPSYTKLNTIILSTSTLSADSVLLGGFAPVNPDSYGVGYSVKDDMIGTNITTYPTRDGDIFNENLKSVLNDLQEVIKSIPSTKEQ